MVRDGNLRFSFWAYSLKARRMPLPFENGIHGIRWQNRYLNYHPWASRCDGPTGIRLAFLQLFNSYNKFNTVAQSCPTLCDPMDHSTPGLPVLSPSPGVYSNSCPLSQWCHPTISSSAIPFSSCLQSFPASGAFQMSQLFTSGGQSIGVSASASFPPKKSQGWSPSEWTGWISLQSKGLSRVFSSTTVQKHQFFGAQLSL